jgi:cytoskeleton-associated protein 5
MCQVWKARVSAYEELTNSFAKSPEDSPVYSRHVGDLKKMVLDANLVAQEVGLGAVVSYLEAAPIALCSRVSLDLVKAVMDKCLASTRTGTRSKALEIILLGVEILENGDSILEVLMGAFSNKQPKLVAQAITTIKEIILGFGVRILNIKPLLKQLSLLFGHSDKAVRTEATQLTVTLYRYLGNTIMTFLGDLKPVQVKDLQESFAAVPQEKIVPTRLTRSQKLTPQTDGYGKPNECAESSEGFAGGQVDDEEQPADAFDLSEPVEILKKMSPNFYTELASTKWKERKEALEALLEIVKTPRIKEDRYGELVNVLAKRINDANIIVATLSIQVLDNLARGLRNEFAPYKHIILPNLLEKLKEKKVNVVEAIKSALDAIYISVCTSLRIAVYFHVLTAFFEYSDIPRSKSGRYRSCRCT